MYTTASANSAPSGHAETSPAKAPPTRSAHIGVAFAAGFTTLAASIANYLVHQGYPLLTAEVALVFGWVAMICALVGLFYLGLGKTTRRVMEGALVALLVDINFADWQWSAAAGAIVFAGLVATRKSILSLLSTFGAIVLAAVLAGSVFVQGTWITSHEGGPASPSAAMRNERPAIVHFIFDEHIGLGGFPKTQAGHEVARELTEFYAERGFRTWPHAYSRHFHTINAIPDILNFGGAPALHADPTTGMVVGDTAYFKRLRQLGYRMTIYQSIYGDFCSGAKPARCVEYDATSPTPTVGAGLSAGRHAYLLAAKFFSLAQMLKPLEDRYERLFRTRRSERGSLLPIPPEYAASSTGVAVLKVMDQVTDDLADIRPGEAFFVHALIPHHPYVADRSCAIKPADEWLHRRDWRPIAEREAAYFEQIRCTQRLIGRVIAALDKSPSAGNYVLILHGDHGSRITGADPRADGSPIATEDFVAGFSTLFAVKFADRAPSAGSESESAIVPVSRLLRELALTDFKALSVTLPATQPSVFLADPHWKPSERRAFPTGW